MRWEHLTEVGPAGRRPASVTPEHWRALGAIARRVHARTGARMYADHARGQLCFGYREPNGRVGLIGLPDLHLFRGRNRTDTPNLFRPHLDAVSEDDVVYLIQLAKVDPKVKARWKREREAQREHEAQSAMDRRWEDTRADRWSRVRSRWERMTMGRHYRGSAVVNGLRGS
jgi:hypothetical protein